VSHRLLASAWVRVFAIFVASVAPLFAVVAYAEAAPPGPTRIVYGTGKIVPIPASIPHAEGDMIDRRLIPNLRWIAKRFPIYVTDGYSGPLPNGEHAGCDECHAKNSDHYNGLAVDLVPLNPSSKCDANWNGITRLALWAEPEQNKPSPPFRCDGYSGDAVHAANGEHPMGLALDIVPDFAHGGSWRLITKLAKWAEPQQNQPRSPFRWVGYDGDAGHGCGHHLHLSWNHAIAPMFQLAEWVETFPVGGPAEPEATPKRKRKAKPKAPAGPPGGIAQMSTGGISARVGD
jgi:hypothetical protein